MEEEYEYDLECYFCDSRLTLIVYQNEEKPTHCPMCGTLNEEEWKD